MGYTAQDWARDPFGVFRSLNAIAMKSAADFNARQRAMPILERKALALRVYAQELKSAQLNAEVNDRMRDIANLRANMENVKFKMNEALQKLISIKSVLAQIPGGGFLGADPRLEVAKYALIATAVLATTVMVGQVVRLFDSTGAALDTSLRRIDDWYKSGKITKEQHDRLVQHAIDAGGITNPGGGPAAVTAFSGSIAVIAIAALIFMNKRGRAAA